MSETITVESVQLEPPPPSPPPPPVVKCQTGEEIAASAFIAAENKRLPLEKERLLESSLNKKVCKLDQLKARFSTALACGEASVSGRGNSTGGGGAIATHTNSSSGGCIASLIGLPNTDSCNKIDHIPVRRSDQKRVECMFPTLRNDFEVLKKFEVLPQLIAELGISTASLDDSRISLFGGNISNILNRDFWEYYGAMCDPNGNLSFDAFHEIFFSQFCAEFMMSFFRAVYADILDEESSGNAYQEIMKNLNSKFATTEKVLSAVKKIFDGGNTKILSEIIFNLIDIDNDGVLSKLDVNIYAVLWLGDSIRGFAGVIFRFLNENDAIEAINSFVDILDSLIIEMLDIMHAPAVDMALLLIDKSLEKISSTNAALVDISTIINLTFDLIVQGEGIFKLFMVAVDLFAKFSYEVPAYKYIQAKSAVLAAANKQNPKAEVVSLLADCVKEYSLKQFDDNRNAIREYVLQALEKSFPFLLFQLKDEAILSDIVAVGTESCRKFILDGGLNGCVSAFVDLFDTNNDGFISPNNWTDLETAIGKVSVERYDEGNHDDIKTIISIIVKAYDVDSSGTLRSADFINFIGKLVEFVKSIVCLTSSFVKKEVASLLIPASRALLVWKYKSIGGDQNAISEFDILRILIIRYNLFEESSEVRKHFILLDDYMKTIADGGQPFEKGDFDEKCLLLASMCGNLVIIESFLRAGSPSKSLLENIICCASISGQVTIVEAVIRAKNELLSYEKSLLLASGGGHAGTVEALIRAGADVNVPWDNEYPLRCACIYGHLETVEVLIRAGADVNAQNENTGITAVIAASGFGHVKIVAILISAGADLNAQTKKGLSALLSASICGHVEIVEVLIRAGADLELSSEVNLFSPLTAAIQMGNLQLVETLIRAKIAKNAQNKSGASLETISNNFDFLVVDALKHENIALLWAARLGYSEAVESLLRAGAKPDIQLAGFEETALMLASEEGHLPVVEALICAGANVDIRNSINGRTALLCASLNLHVEVVEAIIRAGADVDVLDDEGKNALMLVSQYRRPEIQKAVMITSLLLSSGASLVLKNKYDGLLHCSDIRSEFKDVLKFYEYVRLGDLACITNILNSDDNACSCLAYGFNAFGDSAIHIACRYGHLEVVKYLLSHYDDAKMLSLRNCKNNKSVFDYACGPDVVGGGFFSRTKPYRVLDYLTIYKNDRNENMDNIITSLISSLDVNAYSLNDLIKKIIPALDSSETLSYEKDFGGGRYQTITIITVLQYYRERVVFGAKPVMRMRLLLVGAGRSGKTTLVHRLNTSKFKSERVVTDGVEMCDITLRSEKGAEVIFNIFDFAGQKEYTHTHQLFFDKEALFLVLYRPDCDENAQIELEDFVSKMHNCIDSESGDGDKSSKTNTQTTVPQVPASLGTNKTANKSNIIFAVSHCDKYRKFGKLLGFFTENSIKDDIKVKLDQKKDVLFGNKLQSRVYDKILAFDSESGAGYSTLKSTLVDLAWSKPDKAHMVPTRWNSFLDFIKELSERDHLFAISEDELIRKYKSGHAPWWNGSSDDIKIDSMKLAVKIFLCGGLMYKLGNGDLVLQPQKLANVLACVFSNNTIDLDDTLKGKGHIKHDDGAMQNIWGRAPKSAGNKKTSSSSSSSSSKSFHKRYWSFSYAPVPPAAAANEAVDVNNAYIPPFLKLLYDAGLAYPLIDPSSLKPASRSLVPALLRNLPTLPNKKLPWDEAGDIDSICNYKLGLMPEDCKRDSFVELKCTSKWGLPESLLSRLHVDLHGYCDAGLAWKQGFVVEMRYNDSKSIAIVFASYTNQTIYIVSGSDNGIAAAAKCKVVLTLRDIVKKEYKSVLFVGFSDVHVQAQIEDHVNNILIDSKDMPESINNLYVCLKGLISIGKSQSRVTGASKGGGDREKAMNDGARDADDENNSNANTYEMEIINLQHLIFAAIPDILELQGVSPDLDKRHKLKHSCMWILLKNKVSSEVFAFPITPQVDILSDREPWVCSVDEKVALSLTSATTYTDSASNDSIAANAEEDFSSEIDDKDGVLKSTAKRKALCVILEMLFKEMFIEIPIGFEFSSSYFIKDDSDCRKVLEADRNDKKFIYMDQFKRKVTRDTYDQYLQRSRDERDKKKLEIDEENLRLQKEIHEHELRREAEQKMRDARELERDERDKERLLLEKDRYVQEMRRYARDTYTLKMVATLLKGTYDLPTLFVLVPVKNKFFYNYFYREYRLYFVCSHTKRISVCGPRNKPGKGFKIKLQREWVKSALPVLKLTLMIANIALTAVAPGIKIPDVSSLLPSVDFEKVLNHFVDDYNPMFDNLENLDQIIKKSFDSLDIQKSIEKKVEKEVDSLEEPSSSESSLVNKNLIPRHLSLLGFGSDVDPSKYDTIKRFLVEEIDKKYKENWRDLIGLKMVIRTPPDVNGPAISNTIVSDLPAASQVTAWVFDSPEVEASFISSDSPSLDAMKAVDDAYKKIRK